MTLREFHAALRRLRHLDRAEVPFLSEREWPIFAAAPESFFIRCDDPTAEAIWKAMAK